MKMAVGLTFRLKFLLRNSIFVVVLAKSNKLSVESLFF